MKSWKSIVPALLVLVSAMQAARADIELWIEKPVVISNTEATTTLNLWVKSSPADTILDTGIFGQFTPRNGAFTFADPPGEFLQPGMVGYNNVLGPPFAPEYYVQGDGDAVLGLGLAGEETISDEFRLLATLDVNVKDLNPGEYWIDYSMSFDNAELDLSDSFTVVPEPSTLTLALLGLGGFAGVTMFRRRRARKVAA